MHFSFAEAFDLNYDKIVVKRGPIYQKGYS